MRYVLCGLVVLICLTITISINIYPRLISPTTLNVIMALVQAGFIALAVILPAGMELGEARGSKKVVGWAVWGFCILASFTFGMSGSSHFQFDATKEARLEIQDRGTSEQQLAQKRISRQELGSVQPTTEASVAIAKAAHEAAVEGKRTECGTGVGPRCKDWDDTIQVKLTAWGMVSAAYEKAKTARELDGEIKLLETALKGKAVPQSADPMASGWAYILSSVGFKVGEEAIAAWIAIGFALVLEIVGSLAPWVVLPEKRKQSPTTPTKAEPVTVSVPNSVGDKPNRKLGNKRPTKVGELTTSVPNVGEWFKVQARVNLGVEMAAGEAQVLYRKWCDDRGQKKATPKEFSTAMKDELKVPFKNRSGRIFYRIAITGVPKLVKTA
jgi:hypothetical protein